MKNIKTTGIFRHEDLVKVGTAPQCCGRHMIAVNNDSNALVGFRCSLCASNLKLEN